MSFFSLAKSVQKFIQRPAWIDQGIEVVLLLAITITPLIFSPLSNELFEFPKMVWVYVLAIMGLALLLARVFLRKELSVVQHPLARPLTIYIFVFFITTILSVDIYTSIAGYYSRFHGGLASLLAYLVLFYLTLLHLQPTKTQNERINRLLWGWVASSILISLWAIAEHFGYSPSCWLLRGELNAECWVQDVQARVFATFGQPNWLAAYLLTSVPLSFGLLVQSKQIKLQGFAWLGFVLGYAALWYTYSRSGWVGLVVAAVILLPWLWKLPYRRLWPWLISALFICALVSLTTFEPASQRTATALESGNLDSSTGQIRLLVWQGSLDSVFDNFLFGSGPETFPYSFLPNRPEELNQTTEWNFLYNKAHNEVLQMAATTGVVGLLAWLLIYIRLTYEAWKLRIISVSPKHLTDDGIVPASLFAGIAGVFTAQLLGFSVVVTALYFWLATAIILTPLVRIKRIVIKKFQLRLFGFTAAALLTVLTIGLSSYYAAELVARQAGSSLRSNPWRAEQLYEVATTLNPFESYYRQQLALSNAYLAQLSTTTDAVEHYAAEADREAAKAYTINPYHLLNLKGITNVYQLLASVDTEYLEPAISMAQKAVTLDKTDANAQLTLAQLYLQAKRYDDALSAFNMVVALRPQAANSYLQRSFYFEQTNQLDLARSDLQLALKLEPNNDEIIERIQELQE